MKLTHHPGGLSAMSIPEKPDVVLLKPKNGPSFEVEYIVLKAIVDSHEQGVEL